MIKIFTGFNRETVWLFIGLFAQICFFLRFFLQWLVSEKKGKSVMPVSFWYLSILGAIGLLNYAIYRRDPVFIIGQSMGLFVYLRNLILIKKSKRDII
ncbi:MAG: lipid-A-disaccharide synthase N-terminal domain-containing protein [Candidatus Omnitrophota bacterium]